LLKPRPLERKDGWCGGERLKGAARSTHLCVRWGEGRR
jgi:hypothetical protein